MTDEQKRELEAEKDDLDAKLEAVNILLTTTDEIGERGRLIRQMSAMQVYSRCLADRIAFEN